MRTFLDRLSVFFFRYLDRPWYIWFVTFFAAVDLFVGFVPTEVLLITAVIAKPKRWVPYALIVTLGSAVGAAVLAALVDWGGERVVEALLPGAFETEGWKSAARFLDRWGFSAVGLVALSPIPQQPVVMMAALTHIPLWKIFSAVAVGRGIKYLFFAWAASHAPKYVSHFRKHIPVEALKSDKSA